MKIETEDKQSLEYNYDLNGNVNQINDTQNNRKFEMNYDGLNRLISSEIVNYSIGENIFLNFVYDAIGNLLNISSNLENISFAYGGDLAHAPISLSSFMEGNDTHKFYHKDSAGNIVAWLGNEGNIVLKGKCFVGNCSNPGDGSIVFGNSTNDYNAFINSTGDLCISVGDCSDLSPICNPSSDAFIIQNSSGLNMSYISFDGELCLTGELFENSL